MDKFLWWLLVIFLLGFVLQSSHVIQKVRIKDQMLGVDREEYQINFEKLDRYGKTILRNTGDFLEGIPRKINQFKSRQD